ncbi:hypothetical protein [Sulfurospirillum diekertiae]|uniref:Uncharacterized protein n=1 Tax=Sulfurospirillum diekertiae TaxID=1854492 RepID=A0A1Y0HHL7_9BACT|nr:hypothetical protein [Sulfurospirillum diekertiae]ARU47568.1 hypothetical protein Sdiek1_0386 [Sulfurospirillum diekertiae]ASC92416.1 hypothetical protein Sdiek2_0379 [Sulfurospirillum diekertiae]
MSNDQVLTVMSDEFKASYDFYQDYEDMVIHKITRKIFKINFVHGMAQLVPVSNEKAINKIEFGMQSFVEMLRKQGF